MKSHLDLTSDLTFQEVRTVDISAGQHLLCKILLKKHLYLSPKAMDIACKASRATNRN